MKQPDNSVEGFIKLVFEMRQAQKGFFVGGSAKARRDVMNFEKMVDAWIVAHDIDMQKLVKWSGQEMEIHDDA